MFSESRSTPESISEAAVARVNIGSAKIDI
jgi:hypothetical protein